MHGYLIEKQSINTPLTYQTFNNRKESDNKFSWNVGTMVLAGEHQSVILDIIHEDPISQKPYSNDQILVKFENGIVQSYRRSHLKSHPTYIQNRNKLNRYCTIEVYSSNDRKWISSYVERFTNDFLLVEDTHYQYWSNKIRCHRALLNLVKNSQVFIFDADINQWCYGKIVNIDKSNRDGKLDIFTVDYVKHNKVYVKYIHQFSACIALISAQSDQYVDPSLLYAMENGENGAFCRINNSSKTLTDVKWYKLLLEGYLKRGYCICSDVLSIMMKYIGYNYHLVMHIESKTYSLALKNRDNNLSKQPTDLGLNFAAIRPPSINLPDVQQYFENECPSQKEFYIVMNQRHNMNNDEADKMWQYLYEQQAIKYYRFKKENESTKHQHEYIGLVEPESNKQELYASDSVYSDSYWEQWQDDESDDVVDEKLTLQ